MNITDAIRDLARVRPQATALVGLSGIAMPYAALDRLIDRFARRALAHGLRPGDIAGLSLGPPDEALSLILALALARIGVATAETTLPPRHLAAAFLQADAVPPDGVRPIAFDESWLAGDADDTPVPSHRDGAAILRIFSTSGTTGRPSHCPVSHADMAIRIEGRGYPIVSPDWPAMLLCAMGIGGHAGFRGCLTALLAGGTLVFSNLASLPNAVLRHHVTCIALSPHTLQDVLNRIPPGVGPLPSLRALRVSGSQLPWRLAQRAAERLCPNVVTTFGATETGNLCSGRYNARPDVPLAIGTLLPDVAVEAVDDAGEPLPPGAEGELRMRTPGMVTSYFDDDALTRARFRDGWFYPGDRGLVTPDRVLVVSGRTGEFINSGGVKVNPRTIENVLLSLPEVTEAAAFGVPDPDGMAQIWAAIAVEHPVDVTALNRLCTQRLGAQAPRTIMQMKALPRNANGKVLTGELVAYAARHTGGTRR